MLGGEEEGGLAFERVCRGVFCGGAIPKDDGNEDAEGAKEEAKDKTVPALPGACEGAADEGAENPDEENSNGFHKCGDGTRKTGEASSRAREGV